MYKTFHNILKFKLTGNPNSSTSTNVWKFQISNFKKKMREIGHQGIFLLTSIF